MAAEPPAGGKAYDRAVNVEKQHFAALYLDPDL